MLLSKLEIKGFKSFGDKIIINFDEGITGIVGPNGCGKSNIVDAIRWVLGEQKIRNIRAEKMEGIIFNGTKKRKPLQMAEATLTFNNTRNILPTEYSTVSITRKFYRSGESEFLINGIPCRLKDITNLFLDTGIASNSYSIIELSMVDDIIKDKDNSRRLMFEEAAGISKFRIRKKETLRKLDDTDMDLERVEDLLYEIEKNMRSLERQAQQTRKYFKLKEEYKELSLKLANLNLKRHIESLDKIQKQIDRENDNKSTLSRQLAQKEAEIEKAKAGLIDSEKLLASRQKILNEHVGKIRNTESEKKIKNERLRYLNDKSDSLKEQIEQDKKSNERAAFSLQSLNQEKDSAQKILAEIELKLKGLKEEYEEEKERTLRIREEVESINNVYKIRREEVFQINKDLEIKQIQLNTLTQELEKTTSDSSESQASLVEFEDKIKALSAELSQKNQNLDKLKKREEDLQKRIESSEKTIEVIREELAETSRKLDARQNEYNLTKSLVDNLEGFPEAIRFLKKQKGWGKDAPLLSDVLTTEEKYRVTIENYLEPWMNYYVVEKESEAYRAVNILSDASKGRAHFFILENLEKFMPSKSRLYDNAIPASEIVEFDEKYRKLVSYVLDNVYIVTGHHTSIPEDEESIFITQNGKITRRQFSLSGGSVGLFEGKRIGRARNLEILDKEIKKLNKKITQIQHSLSEEQHDLVQLKNATQKNAIEHLQNDINIINESFVSLKTKQEQYEQLITNQSTKKEDFLSRMDQLAHEIRKLNPEAEKEQIELETLGSKLTQLENDLKNQNELLSIKSNAFNQENLVVHQQQNKVNSIEQEIGYKTSALESSRERIDKNLEELRKNEEEIRKLIEKTDLSDEELTALYKEKDGLEKSVMDSEKDYYAARGQIDQLEKEERNIQHSREAVDTLLLELQGKLNETKLEISSVKERMSVEFNVKLDDILTKSYSEEEDLGEEELRRQVESQHDKLDRIGPINPMAMEAYDEIKTRHDFITGQRDDLLKAKESLMTTIEEIDMVAKATFMEAFEKIKLNFMKVFRSLFSEEDDCDIRLTIPEDPLNSSVDIIAKPKGKRPLSINQLSGGEKALTATSLLFAIYLLKPAPFCIFDEVDAPLDDANIDKFNMIVRKFSADSQFIIVTHNKRTMATTDIIYGITMVEQGVSKVVPVDLRELQD